MLTYNFWLSWYNLGKSFNLEFPWWADGTDADDRDIVCAAVKAESVSHAWELVKDSYPEDHEGPTFVRRFIEHRPHGWVPYNDKFPKQEGMKW